MSKKVLGRGLGAFFPDIEGDESSENSSKALPVEPAERVNIIMQVPVEFIRANPHQPRTDFDEIKLQELSDSIKKYGLNK